MRIMGYSCGRIVIGDILREPKQSSQKKKRKNNVEMKNIPGGIANILYTAEEIEKLSGDCRT